MSILSSLKRILFPHKITEPQKAYDVWAANYDQQPGNLVLAMDEELFVLLLGGTDLQNRTVVDIGCGTGRHWPTILRLQPGRLAGYDVSPGMLQKLKNKFPEAEVWQLHDHHLQQLENESVDCIVSTLALAHMPDFGAVIQEWNRVLKPGGIIILTDYHPVALERGGERTFRHEGKLIAVRNYIYPLEQVRNSFRQLGIQEIRFAERVIDDSVKSYYEEQNALALFERFKGVPMIYGLHLKKTDEATQSTFSG